MISNVVVMVRGRKALPLRAIPYVTAWAESPDSVIRALCQPVRLTCRGFGFANSRALTAYAVGEDGSPNAVPPDQWRHIEKELECSTLAFQANEREGAEGENHAAWRAHAVLALPQNGFVWLDDFQIWFAKSRPLQLPTDDEVACWKAEQTAVCEPEELASVLADGMQLGCMPAALHLEVVLPPSLDGKLWLGKQVVPAAGTVVLPRSEKPGETGSVSENLERTKRKPKRRGRPRTQETKSGAIQIIVEAYIDHDLVGKDRRRLPGTVEAVLKACQAIEKQCTGKLRLFGVGAKSFQERLSEAGYAMRPGRKREEDVDIWMQHAAAIAGEMAEKIFSGD